VQKMIEQGLVIEPLVELYKAEVRELGETLGLPEEIVWRHPFPGPGLGIRLLCSNGEISEEQLLTDSQAALDSALSGTALKGTILPVRSVGVKADLRSYEHPVMLWGDFGSEDPESVAGRIFQKVPGVNRCVIDLTGIGARQARPLAATVTRERLDLLREADAIMMDALRHHGLYRTIWQCPTVLVPLEINGSGKEFVIVRPVLSERGMTARPALLPRPVAKEICDRILNLNGISGVAMDVTTKPPGTIEWE